MPARRPSPQPDDASDAEPQPAAAGRRGTRAAAAATERLDRELLELIQRRAAGQLEQQAARSGTLLHGAAATRYFEQLVDQCPGPLPRSAALAMLRELYSGLRAAAHPCRVAYLGPPHTFSHLAALGYFGHSVELLPVGSIAAVFEEVEREQADFGVVPIENSTDGRVADALHCLARSTVQICGEAPLRIRHCLLGIGPRSGLRRICSKPQALSQCRNWLAKHLPDAQLVETASTAAAAELAASDPTTAAIASAEAGTSHGLEVLARHIEDNPDNVTRFAVIGRSASPKTGDDKTALVFETPHAPGALADAMNVFKRFQLNLTWIESFPAPEQRGRYLFFVEFLGHATDLRVRRALASLAKKALRITVLGSYAQAATIG